MDRILGLSAEELSIWQMCLRAVVVYIIALMMVRIVGDRRFIGKYAAFDVIVSIIFGSTMSRAINGSSAFFSTICSGLILIGMHWLFGTLSYSFPKLEAKIKGRSLVLIKDGRLCESAMRSCSITSEDLLTSLRLKLQIDKLDNVKRACLERNGEISFTISDRINQN